MTLSPSRLSLRQWYRTAPALLATLPLIACGSEQITSTIADPRSVSALTETNAPVEEGLIFLDDAQRIQKADQDRPGIIPPEILDLAQTTPGAVSFCQFFPILDTLEPDPINSNVPLQLIYQSERCETVGAAIDGILPPDQFPQGLPNQVNSVVVTGEAEAAVVVKRSDDSEIQALLPLDEIKTGQTRPGLVRQQGYLALNFRGTGPVKLYSNAGSVSEPEAPECEDFVGADLPRTVGQRPTYASFLFEDSQGQERAVVYEQRNVLLIRLNSPVGGCVGIGAMGTPFAGQPFVASIFRFDATGQ